MKGISDHTDSNICERVVDLKVRYQPNDDILDFCPMLKQFPNVSRLKIFSDPFVVPDRTMLPSIQRITLPSVTTLTLTLHDAGTKEVECLLSLVEFPNLSRLESLYGYPINPFLTVKLPASTTDIFCTAPFYSDSVESLSQEFQLFRDMGFRPGSQATLSDSLGPHGRSFSCTMTSDTGKHKPWRLILPSCYTASTIMRLKVLRQIFKDALRNSRDGDLLADIDSFILHFKEGKMPPRHVPIGTFN
jgi:hypothetical protein